MRRTRIGIGLAIFGMAVVLGYSLARPLAPARLHAEVEARLAEALGGTVDLGELRVYLGWGIRFEGRNITVWPGEAGGGLQVARLVADVRPFSHLTGQLRLRNIRLEDATLVVSRDAAGAWTPAAFGGVSTGLASEPTGQPHPHELLRPLIALESGVRNLLARHRLADQLSLQNGRVEWIDAFANGEAVEPLVIENLHGTLRRRGLFGGARLALQGRLSRAGTELGSFEWDGSHSRSEALRLALALTDLELAILAPYLRPDGAVADLRGRLSGALVFETSKPGHGRLEIDAVGRALRSTSGSAAPWELGALESTRSEIGAELAISPGAVWLKQARIVTDELGFEMDGTLQRPLHPDSWAELALTLRDISVVELRHMLGWLPEVRREEAATLLERIETGRLRTLRTAGAATLSGWQAFLAGRTAELPRDFVIDATLAGTTVRVGESDRLNELEGRLWWTGDRLQLRGVVARLNDTPLPRLDLSVEGLGHLFATQPAQRRLGGSAPPLDGLATLWRVLRRPDAEAPVMAPVALEIERLDHPVFFWPIVKARAELAPTVDGLHVAISGGTWAGAPVEGELSWQLEPEERVQVRLVARPGGDAPLPPLPAGSWARGRFSVGAVRAGRWAHEEIRGHFEAGGGTLWLSDADVQLTPAGRGTANLRLELDRGDRVPFELDFSVNDADVPSMTQLVKLPPRFLTGRVDGAGSLSGSLAPGQRLSPTLQGLIEVSARDGAIRQEVPAVMAIALASEAFNPFSRRDHLRYDRLETILEFDRGTLHTDGLLLEGPDVRAFASGEADVGSEPHEIDVQVVLFLFRPIDSIIQKIPIVNFLLLGKNENLMAAHYQLSGPWKQPEAKLVPLRTLATAGPGGLLFETVPSLVKRGLEALDSLVTPDEASKTFPLTTPASRPSES